MDRRDLEFCRPYRDELIVALLDGRTDQTAVAHSATFWPCSSMKHVDGARFFFTRTLGPDCHAKTETSEPAIDVRVRGRRQEQGLDAGGDSTNASTPLLCVGGHATAGHRFPRPSRTSASSDGIVCVFGVGSGQSWSRPFHLLIPAPGWNWTPPRQPCPGIIFGVSPTTSCADSEIEAIPTFQSPGLD